MTMKVGYLYRVKDKTECYVIVITSDDDTHFEGRIVQLKKSSHDDVKGKTWICAKNNVVEIHPNHNDFDDIVNWWYEEIGSREELPEYFL